VSTGNECITHEDFVMGAKILVEALGCIRTNTELLWSWNLQNSNDGEVFLEHATAVRLHNKDCHTLVEEAFVDDSVLQDSSCQVEPSSNDTTLFWTEWNFSIVYSHTWQVPVLYFAVQASDGEPLGREFVVHTLQGMHHQNQVEDSLEFVSYDQHPITGIPCCFLHACQTKERMKLVTAAFTKKSNSEWLLTWMSLIFPSVGFAIPAKVYKQLSARICELETEGDRLRE
jgi:hypothetical protein